MAKVFDGRKIGRSGWWIDYVSADGKRHRELVGPSHALAKEVLAKRMNETAEGRNFPERHANAQIFRDFADKFWTLHGSRLRSPWWGSKNGDEWGGMIGLWVREFGTKRLSEIKTADVQAAYNRIASAHKGATANRYYTLLRLIFNCAEKWGDYYGVNPCKGVRREAESVSRTRYLSRDEMIAFLPHCHPRLVPVVLCALLTGMRRGEIFALEWPDLDFAAGVLTIRQSKSGKPRVLSLPGRLRDVLLALRPRREGKVFELPRVMFYRYFDKARKDSGLQAFRFHDLRHTFASHFIMQTRDLRTLQAVLGHATPTMTMRYAHLDREHVAAKMAQVEAVIPLAPALPLLPAPVGPQDASPLPVVSEFGT